MNQTCAICDQTEVISQTTIFLGKQSTHFLGGGKNEKGYVKVSLCAKCRAKLDSAEFPKRLWFVVTGFLAVLAILGIAMGVVTAQDGGGIDAGLTAVVSLLGLGVVVSFVFYRRAKERLRERLVQWLSKKSSESVENPPESPNFINKLVESKGGRIVVALLVLMLVVGLGGLLGVIMWEVIKGIAVTVLNSPRVIAAAIVGAAVSMTGFVLFTLVLSMFGPILSVAFEQWTMTIAPLIGGTIGAAIADGFAVNVVYIVALGALIGGISSVIHGVITAKKRISLNAIREHLIAGVGIGAINGIIMAIFFKVLAVTLGLNWLLTS